MYILFAILLIYLADSIAVLPPPKTITVLFLYKAPSHMVQYDIPFPSYLLEFLHINFLGVLPDAINIYFA